MAAGCMLHDRLDELWLRISQLHLTYLEADESPRKLEEKRRLEAHIKDYLYIAPHERKFCLDATREVLHRSVESKEDFSAFRATQAWRAIATYADNLLAQPWRKEFQEIKTYCGYYTHHVKSGLVGAELILEAMGYKHTSHSTLILDGPVDPDRVSIVSQDSLIAVVECQIMRTIYAEVIKIVPSCSWSDVLHFREQNPGTAEQAITCLNYRLHQEHNAYSRHPRIMHMETCGAMARYPYANLYNNRYNNYSCSQPRYNHTVISPVQAYPSHPYMAHPHANYYDQYYGYYPMKNGCVTAPMPIAPCPVPTAQLIDFDPPIDSSVNTHRRSSSDHLLDRDYHKNHTTDRHLSHGGYNRDSITEDVPATKREKNIDSENWDFVYKALEGKHGDLVYETLQPTSAATSDRYDSKYNNDTTPELDEALKRFCLDDCHQITVPDLRPNKSNEANKINVSPSKNSFSNINIGDASPPLLLKNNNVTIVPSSPKHYSQTMKQEKKNAPKDESSKFLSVDSRKLRVKLTDEKWECITCTYHNSTIRDVCEMCGKSKKVGSECRPLASGGRQCPQCTLVNEKGVTTCEACGCCLKDSPTYI